MKKTIVYLDMDGTIYPLYEIENWLDGLRGEIKGLFNQANPYISEEKLFEYFPKEKYEIKILSMTPKDASKTYCDIVIQEKNEWLDKFFPNITNRIYLPYGQNKNLKNSKDAILVDDSEPIRKNFKGKSFAPLWL